MEVIHTLARPMFLASIVKCAILTIGFHSSCAGSEMRMSCVPVERLFGGQHSELRPLRPIENPLDVLPGACPPTPDFEGVANRLDEDDLKRLGERETVNDRADF